MRVKRSVDFRMAPKKSSKGKGAAAEPAHEKGWNTSKCSESDLETLVSAGFWFPDLLSNGVLPWAKIIRMKIRGKLLLLHLTWNEDWGFLVHFSSLGSYAITGSSFIT